MKRFCWMIMLCASLVMIYAGVLWGADKWPGIDDAVVKKIASQHGREAKEPLINTGEGDLQLFVFLTAGALGGFVAGYYWRVLMEGRKKDKSSD